MYWLCTEITVVATCFASLQDLNYYKKQVLWNQEEKKKINRHSKQILQEFALIFKK